MADGGRLSWNNVEAPDFSSAMRGLALAGSSFDGAFDAGKDVTTGIQGQLALDANRQLQRNLLSYTDPDQLRQAIASGATMQNVQNAGYLTPDEIAKQGDGVAALLDQKAKSLQNTAEDEKNTESKWTFGRTQKLTAGMDNASPAINQALLKAVRGDRAGAAEFLSDPANAATVGNLTAGQLNDVLANVQNVGTTDLSQQTTAQAIKQGGTRFGWETLEHDDQIAAQSALKAAIPNIRTAADIDTFMNTNPDVQKLTGRAFLAVRSSLQQMFGGGDGSAGGAGGGSGGAPGSGAPGGGTGYSAVYGNGTYGGIPPVDPQQMTLAQVLDYGDKVLRPATKAKGIGVDAKGNVVGTSAMGGYQIEGSTLREVAPQVLGAGWQNMQFTPEVQDKLGRAIYDRAPVGSDLHKIWTSLPTGTIKARGMDWAAIQPKIMQGESAGVPSPLDMHHATVATDYAGTLANQDDPYRNFARDVSQVANSKDSNSKVVADLVGDPKDGNPYAGVLKGAPKEEVSQWIDKIMADGKIKQPAVAAAVLARSLKSHNSMTAGETALWTLAGDQPTNLAKWLGAKANLGGQIVDSDALKQNMSFLDPNWKGDKKQKGGMGNLLATATNDADINTSRQMLPALEQNYNSLYSDYVMAQNDVRAGRKSESVLGPALIKLKTAYSQLSSMQARVAGQAETSLDTPKENGNQAGAGLPPPPPANIHVAAHPVHAAISQATARPAPARPSVAPIMGGPQLNAAQMLKLFGTGGGQPIFKR